MKGEKCAVALGTLVGGDVVAHHVTGTECVAGFEAEDAGKNREPVVATFPTPPDVTTLTVDGFELLCDGSAVGMHPEAGMVHFKRRVVI